MSSIKPKLKPCNGIGKAISFQGCQSEVYKRTYGLCDKCYAKWLYSTGEGRKRILKTIIKPKSMLNIENKPKNKLIAFPEVYLKENKRNFQNEINKLARKIDSHFYSVCIDCGNPFGKQIDGSHYHNVSGNENIRYNLHNIHAARQQCNQYQGGRKEEYFEGLIRRYDVDYAEYVKYELPKKYPYIGLKAKDYVEKLKIVRKLIRTFDKFIFENAKEARENLNKIIGIYDA